MEAEAHLQKSNSGEVFLRVEESFQEGFPKISDQLEVIWTHFPYTGLPFSKKTLFVKHRLVVRVLVYLFQIVTP